MIYLLCWYLIAGTSMLLMFVASNFLWPNSEIGQLMDYLIEPEDSLLDIVVLLSLVVITWPWFLWGMIEDA